jgi:hypothetical protein
MAYVNSVTGGVGASPITTASVDMATGNANVLVIAVMGAVSTQQTGITISDSSGNVYRQLYNQRVGADDNLAVFICTLPTVTTTMTATASWSGGGSLEVWFAGFSGRQQISPIDCSGSIKEGATVTVHKLTTLYPSITGCDAVGITVIHNTTLSTGWSTGVPWVVRSTASSVTSAAQTQDNVTVGSVQNTINTTAVKACVDFSFLLLPVGYVGESVGINWDSR